jgi:hypothetical protein
VTRLPIITAAEEAKRATGIARELVDILDDYAQLLTLPEAEARTEAVSELAAEKVRELIRAFGAAEYAVHKRAVENECRSRRHERGVRRTATESAGEQPTTGAPL